MFYFSNINFGVSAMRLLALVFPRLGIQLARKADRELIGKPVALLTGTGDSSLIALPSVEATAAGIETGMTIAQARERVPALVALPDSAGPCLDMLDDIAAIIRNNATPNVAIVSRDAILVSLQGLEDRFEDETAAANAVVRFARMWSGLDARAGVGATREGALHAARGARRFPVLCAEESAVEALPRALEPIGARSRWNEPATSAEVNAKVAR
jgi:protein ImuB